MKSCLSTIRLGIAVFAFFGFQPVEAGCQLIHATHSARSQAKAVQTSQALALQSAYDCNGVAPHHSVCSPGAGRALLESRSPPRGSSARKTSARPRHRTVLHDLFYGRSRPLRLHYGCERLRPMNLWLATS